MGSGVEVLKCLGVQGVWVFGGVLGVLGVQVFETCWFRCFGLVV